MYIWTKYQKHGKENKDMPRNNDEAAKIESRPSQFFCSFSDKRTWHEHGLRNGPLETNDIAREQGGHDTTLVDFTRQWN